LVITGHGQAMEGPAMRRALRRLASEFDRVAMPEQGEYVEHAANVESGTAYRPPK
jgi:hypothetical protein